MLRKVFLIGIVTLVVAVPAQANRGKELRISGPVVRVSAQAVSVENRVGDAMLTCTVPARLAEKVSAFKVGDKVRMLCVRHKGRRAELRMIGPAGDKAEKPREKTDETSDEKKPDEKRGEKQMAVGQVAELGAGVIVVQSETGRLACKIPAEKQARLAELKVGDKVKIYCLGGVLVGMERAPVADEPKAGDERKLVRPDQRTLARVRDRPGRGRFAHLHDTRRDGGQDRGALRRRRQRQDDVPRLRARVPREGLRKRLTLPASPRRAPAASRPRACGPGGGTARPAPSAPARCHAA